MLILGVTDGERPAAALVREGRLAAVRTAAEPYTGPGYPWSVADALLAEAGVDLSRVGRIVFGSHVPPGAGSRTARRGARWLRDMALEETGLWTVSASVRRRRQTERLRQAGYTGDVKTFDHYRALCHAAWRCQASERVLVLVASSDGDGTTLAVQAGDHDGLRLLYRQGGLSSLRAHVAAAAADTRPWRAASTLPERAADSEAPEHLEDLFARRLHFSAGGFNLALRSGARTLSDALTRYTPGEVAAACQRNLARQVRRVVHHWIRRTGITRLAVAGDVFANPGICHTLATHDDVDEFFVLPTPVPLATAVGAAMRYADAGPSPLSTPYLGPLFGDSACARALDTRRVEGRRNRRPVADAVECLLGGGVQAWVHGPAAMGFRSLGHRSLLARAEDAAACARVQGCASAAARASCSAIVPRSLGSRAFHGLSEVDEAAALGAVPLRPTRWLRARCPALGAEPVLAQLVAAEASPALDGILAGLGAQGAVPVLLGCDLRDAAGDEPDTAGEALQIFVDSDADALQLGPLRVEHPRRG